MPYEVPQHIAPNKVFIVNFSELEGRLEPEFYRPSIASLEKHICSLSSHKLRDYALSIAGGATPPKTEAEKYYTNPELGIPFLRVQNLQTNGELSLNDCVYINEDTHNGLLKRSQVAEGDLLIKITGVGRMAVASVAPKGFIGNTNQHMVVIKTGDAELSKYLAHYLNLDIIEKIASRHSTGGTRPALDYPSLKSIPIIEDIDFSLIDKALKEKKEKEEKACKLLDNIDYYLLNVLGIKLPQSKSQTLQDRMFTVSYSKVCGGRLDPKLYSTSTEQLKQSILDSPYDKQSLKDFIKSNYSGDWGIDESEEVNEKNHTKCLIIRATEFDNTYNLRLHNSRVKYRWIDNSKLSRMNILTNDLLIEKSGGSEDQPVGRIAILTDHILKNNRIAYSNFIHKISVDGINPMYLYYYLKTMHNIKITDSMQSQTNGIRNLIMQEYFNQTIVVPPSDIQQEIVNHITNIRLQAKALQQEGRLQLENAKQEVEQMITGYILK